MQNVYIYVFRVPPLDAKVNMISKSTLFTIEVNIAVLFQIINLHNLNNLFEFIIFYQKIKTI